MCMGLKSEFGCFLIIPKEVSFYVLGMRFIEIVQDPVSPVHKSMSFLLLWHVLLLKHIFRVYLKSMRIERERERFVCVCVCAYHNPRFFLQSSINLNFLDLKIINSRSRSNYLGIFSVHLDIVGEPVLGVLQSSVTGKEMGSTIDSMRLICRFQQPYDSGRKYYTVLLFNLV
jgi:hypothetical protein